MDNGIEVVTSMMVTGKKKWLSRDRGNEVPGTGNCRSKRELRTKVKHTPHADVNPSGWLHGSPPMAVVTDSQVMCSAACLGLAVR